jgi:nucleotide-binding universal stress UspA family protein
MASESLRRVFHPTDFTQGDDAAFIHALKLALMAKAELSLLHVDEPNVGVDWSEFPSVRRTLHAWGLVPEHATRHDVSGLGLNVEKISRHGREVADEIREFVTEHEPDLVVLATHQRRGLDRLTHASLSRPIARAAGVMTLFVPRRVLGFVSPESGRVHLDTILVPVDRRPDPQRAVDVAIRMAELLGVAEARFLILHVGAQEDAPAVRLPARAGWTFEQQSWPGDVVEHILGSAEANDADLIVMSTAGPHGFLDALRGSTTERIVRGAKCPVLAVPVHAPK